MQGQPPEYLHGHSISRSSPAYIRAIRTLSEESGVPYSADMPQKGEYVLAATVTIPSLSRWKSSWKPMHWRMSGNIWMRHWGTNTSFWAVMSALWMQICSVTRPIRLIRCKDHEVFTSDFVKNWILRNNVELITYRDLK